MEKLKVFLWEEWSALSLEPYEEAELAGLIQGLDGVPWGDEFLLRTPRRFVLRRFFRLWGKVRSSADLPPPRLQRRAR